jgi:hypothetical protein
MRSPSFVSTSIAVDRNVPNSDMDAIKRVSAGIDDIKSVEGSMAVLEAVQARLDEIVNVSDNMPSLDQVVKANDLVDNLSVEVTMVPNGEVASSTVEDSVIKMNIPEGPTGVQGEVGAKGETGNKVVPEFTFAFNEDTGDIDYSVTYTEENS